MIYVLVRLESMHEPATAGGLGSHVGANRDEYVPHLLDDVNPVDDSAWL